MELTVNNNRVYWNGYYWVVESVDGQEFYLDKDAAILAASKPDYEEDAE